MRRKISLNGRWDLRVQADDCEDLRLDRTEWPHSVAVPGAWELTLGPLFDGACWYRRTFARPGIPRRHRVWLHFEAVATHAQVWINGRKAGRHSGDWTPFEFDVTDLLTEARNLLVLRVREDADHVTRGFTCIAMPHHGGIWQDAYLEIRPEERIHEPVCIASDFDRKQVSVSVEANGHDGCEVRVSILSIEGSQPIETVSGKLIDGKCRVTLSAESLEPWSVDSPTLYRAKIVLFECGRRVDQITERFGFREVRAEGRRVLLNGEPIYPRGWLTWGVYPELIAPAPTPAQVRREFTALKRLGFNMAKLCLWMPPKHYLDIADEMGVLIWMEYPTWQTTAQFGPQHHAEFDELFLRDRNHPCKFLHSLTCEANLSPTVGSEDEFRYLYDRAKELIPGSLVIDNSGFAVGWSSARGEMHTDLYSDHPYLDCHVFPAHLENLITHLSAYPERPFITGESMDCDTYRSSKAFRKHFDGKLPWWMDFGDDKPWPLCLTSVPTQEEREQRSEAETGWPLPEDITRLSYKHALAHVSYQVSEYRKRNEFTGYTLIGVRDSVGNTPGFYDDLMKLKYTPSQMTPWNADTVLLLDTHCLHRNLRAGSIASFDILASCFDPKAAANGTLAWKVTTGRREIASGAGAVSLPMGQVGKVGEVTMRVPNALAPKVYTLRAEMTLGSVRAVNAWRLWAFPEAKFAERTTVLDSSHTLSHLHGVTIASPDSRTPSGESLVIADCVTPELAQWVDSGGRAVIVVRQTGSLPTEPAPFWREATEVFVAREALGDFPHEGFVDLQFLTLSSDHRMQSAPLAGKADILIRRTNPRTFLYGEDLIQMKLGKGAIVACAFNLGGPDNLAGSYLLSQLAAYAADCTPTRGMTAGELLRLQD